MNLELKNRRALVCGSTQGIGKAVAMELAALGANVTLVARNEQALKQAKSELPAKEGQLHSYVCADFNDPDALAQLIGQLVQRTGPVNILVNNTGGPPSGPISSAEKNSFLSAFNQHLICNHLLVQVCMEGMKASGYGRIINIISTSVKQPLPNLGVSNTIRAAVANWSKTMANELGKFGITVNNVLPGATATQRLQSIISAKAGKTGQEDQKVSDEMKQEIPLGRFADPSEVAAAVAFLASPAASYINGINLPVDGGRTSSLRIQHFSVTKCLNGQGKGSPFTITFKVMIRELQVAAAFVLLAKGYPAINHPTLIYTQLYTSSYFINQALLGLNGEDDALVSCTRTISAGSKAASIRVRITIKKGATTGFSRYSDVLPKGAQVESVVTDGSSFSVADGKVRFVWVNAPTKEVLNIEYTLTGVSASVKLKGEYSYLEGSRTKKFEFPAEPVDIAALGSASTQEKPVKSEQVQKNEPVMAPKKKSQQTKTAETKKATSEIVFKVQVGAFRKKRASAGRLRKKFKLTSPLESEKRDGFTKFMTGKFSDFEEARHRKDEIVSVNGINSAFVVAYRNGKRITVTEAKELTRQNQGK